MFTYIILTELNYSQNDVINEIKNYANKYDTVPNHNDFDKILENSLFNSGELKKCYKAGRYDRSEYVHLYFFVEKNYFVVFSNYTGSCEGCYSKEYYCLNDSNSCDDSYTMYNMPIKVH